MPRGWHAAGGLFGQPAGSSGQPMQVFVHVKSDMLAVQQLIRNYPGFLSQAFHQF